MKQSNSNQKPPGAGIVIVREFSDGWKVLGLKLYGKYDLPKGKLDQNESTIEAAIRETREESNITQLDFKWGTGTLVLDCLTIYVASTNQECQIQKNPMVLPSDFFMRYALR